MDDIVKLAQQFKDELEALDNEALERIVVAYQRIFRILEDKIDALLLEIANLENPSQGSILKLARYKELERQVIEEITRFQSYLITEILNASELSYTTASAQ